MKPALHAQYPSIADSTKEGTRNLLLSIPFEHLNHAFRLSVAESLYDGAKQSSKQALVPSGIGNAWLPGYYRSFIFDPKQDRFLTDLLKLFRKIRKDQSLDSDRYLELMTAFVQTIPYDYQKTASLDTAPRFPVETVVDGCGICSDKSLLLAAMLTKEGYSCAILHFGHDHHAAVGIPVPAGYDFAKCGYAVIETTAVSYIGGAPLAPDGPKQMRKPTVIPIGSGSRTYGAIRDLAKIHAVLAELSEKLKPEGTLASELTRLQKSIDQQTVTLRALKTELESGTLPEEEDTVRRADAHARVLRLQQTIRQYNALANEFTDAQKLMAFMHVNRLDRTAVMTRLSAITPRKK